MSVLKWILFYVLFLLGLTVVFDNRHRLYASFDRFWQGAPERVTRPVTAPAPEPLPVRKPAKSDHVIQIGAHERGRLNVLSQFPDTVKLSFPMPGYAAPLRGHVLLNLQGDLRDTASGQIRITVNGVKRMELTVDGGPVAEQIRLPLDELDFVLPTTEVVIASEGMAMDDSCGVDWQGGLSVFVEDGSHLELIFDQPLTHPDDILLTAGAPMRFAWPLKQPEAARDVFKLAYLNSDPGQEVLFATKDQPLGLSFEPDLLATLIDRTPQELRARRAPLDLARALGRKRAVQFEDDAHWSVSFDRRDHAAGTRVHALDLKLDLDTTGIGEGWLFVATLNNEPVHSEVLEAGSTGFSRIIPFFGMEQLIENKVRLSLHRASTSTLRCSSMKPSFAVVQKADLRLVSTGNPTPWQEVNEVLQGPADIRIHEGLRPLGAQLALATLLAIDPDMTLSSASAHAVSAPLVSALPGWALADVLSGVEEDRSWLVILDGQDRTIAHVHRVDQFDALEDVSVRRGVLLIEAAPNSKSAWLDGE